MMLSFEQFVDQSGGGSEPNFALLPTCCDAQSGSEVRLAGATIAQKQDRLLALKIASGR
jgi:hypothetical protein